MKDFNKGVIDSKNRSVSDSTNTNYCKGYNLVASYLFDSVYILPENPKCESVEECSDDVKQAIYGIEDVTGRVIDHVTKEKRPGYEYFTAKVGDGTYYLGYRKEVNIKTEYPQVEITKELEDGTWVKVIEFKDIDSMLDFLYENPEYRSIGFSDENNKFQAATPIKASDSVEHVGETRSILRDVKILPAFMDKIRKGRRVVTQEDIDFVKGLRNSLKKYSTMLGDIKDEPYSFLAKLAASEDLADNPYKELLSFNGVSDSVVQKLIDSVTKPLKVFDIDEDFIRNSTELDMYLGDSDRDKIINIMESSEVKSLSVYTDIPENSILFLSERGYFINLK